MAPPFLGHRKVLSFLLALITLSSCISTNENSLGAVSSESKLCSELGAELLKRGGNAADALVGTTLCVGVVGMHHSGIGGGGFMLVRDSHGKYESIDYRETAPAAAHKDMYEGNVKGSIISGLASGVPGDLRGLEYLHRKYGILPWRAVCNPAVHVARYGFPVTEDLVRYMDAATRWQGPFFTDDPQWAIDFAPNGTRVGLNDTITRKRYAITLEKIAKHGSKAFYEGEIANYTISAIQAANGTMTLSDLSNYAVIAREPIHITYKNYTLYSCGVPSGGSVALSILKIIEGYDSPDLNLSTHRLNEAMRFSYAARTELGDPDFFSDMNSFEAQMLKPKTAANYRKRISDHHTKNISDYGPIRYSLPENHGTSHIVAADASGMSVTSTSTVNLLFGNLLVIPETGVIMNNEMNDFSIPGVPNEFEIPPSPINFIAAHKRPLSSISPIIIEHPNGTLYLSIGAAGGSRIITSTVQTIWHILEHNMTLVEALAQPRIHDQLLPERTTFEENYDNGVVESMREKGHHVKWVGGHESSVQGVRRLWNGSLEAGSEPRQKNSGGVVV